MYHFFLRYLPATAVLLHWPSKPFGRIKKHCSVNWECSAALKEMLRVGAQTSIPDSVSEATISNIQTLTDFDNALERKRHCDMIVRVIGLESRNFTLQRQKIIEVHITPAVIKTCSCIDEIVRRMLQDTLVVQFRQIQVKMWRSSIAEDTIKYVRSRLSLFWEYKRQTSR